MKRGETLYEVKIQSEGDIVDTIILWLVINDGNAGDNSIWDRKSNKIKG